MGENLYKTTGTFTPDKLIADLAIPMITKGITVAKGEGKLNRGTLLGLSSDGTYKRTDTVETTESATTTIGADGILTDDIDATEENVITTVYVSGLFYADAILLSGEKKIADHEMELRKLGIFIKAVQEY